MGVIGSGFAIGILDKVLVGVCWITEEMGWVLEKVALELSVEEVFNVGAEVEVGLELKVVEDWTTEGDELADWTEEGVSD